MQTCEICGSKRWFSKINPKTGLQVTRSDGGKFWCCSKCGREKVYTPAPPVETKANILYIDTEISLSELFNYGLKVPSKFINPDNLKKDYFMICWTASYVGSRTVFSDCVTPGEARNWNDRNILKQLNALMKSADIIAGHNVDAFDIKRANLRFLMNGLDPIVGKKTIDTLKVAKSKFTFASNRLDFISKKLGLRGKDDISDDDWRRIVINGDEKTLKRVMKYNVGDVVNGKGVLEKLMKSSIQPANFGAVVLA